jgi:hypothetical protein
LWGRKFNFDEARTTTNCQKHKKQLEKGDRRAAGGAVGGGGCCFWFTRPGGRAAHPTPQQPGGRGAKQAPGGAEEGGEEEEEENSTGRRRRRRKWIAPFVSATLQQVSVLSRRMKEWYLKTLVTGTPLGETFHRVGIEMVDAEGNTFVRELHTAAAWRRHEKAVKAIPMLSLAQLSFIVMRRL